MKKLTYDEFVKKELENWLYLNSTGKELPSIVQRVLETAYKNHTRSPEELKKMEKWLLEITGE